jgi:sulfur-oxidizing protein SoxX
VVRQHPMLIAAILALASGCGADRQASAGFRLPPGGNAEAGKAAFLALGCNSCHTVSDLDLPRPAAPPPVPVVLGGTVNHPPTDGQLVTSVIYPSDQLARYPARDIQAAGESRMPHYADRMTVQQLTDIVAFLHAQYKRRPPAPLTPY